MNNQEKPERPFSCFGYVLLFILAMCLIAVFACNTSKQATTDTETTRIIDISDTSSFWQKKYEEAERRLEEERQSKAAGIVFRESKPKLLTDTLYIPDCPDNVIEVGPDGSLKASGNIESFDLVENAFRLHVTSLQKQLEEAAAKLKVTTDSLTIVKSKIVASKKSKPAFQWWLLVIGAAGGLFAGMKLKSGTLVTTLAKLVPTFLKKKSKTQKK